ncbi:MAG: hypothetical protein ABWY06_13030 [Pseudomonas sp.]|uniref:hypothetical protein n=1 Tax=Pseudomonas sp. TaxID=306 RepID=UPI0033966D82
MRHSISIAIVITLSIIHYSIMGYFGQDPAPESEALMAWSFALMVAMWCQDDAKKQKFHRPYEFGAFIFFTWIIVLPAYLVRTRGWRGWLVFLAFLFLSLVPYLCGWIAYYANPEYRDSVF